MRNTNYLTPIICIIAMAIILLSSCEKESIETDCGCGKISNDGVTQGQYWIEVRNNCTSNKKIVYMDADLWMDAHVGEARCYTEQW